MSLITSKMRLAYNFLKNNLNLQSNFVNNIISSILKTTKSKFYAIRRIFLLKKNKSG